ncbi:MAG: Hsp33 family molecular chaperone HslO, partial [Lachnospiraceae bacterium]|nr:Hsp33 family molecular chaperone HslO [Lachnospiraceae bacterium]
MADTIIRATAAGARIRAFVADTKETVMTAYEKHDTYPVMTAALGRLLTAG